MTPSSTEHPSRAWLAVAATIAMGVATSLLLPGVSSGELSASAPPPMSRLDPSTVGHHELDASCSAIQDRVEQQESRLVMLRRQADSLKSLLGKLPSAGAVRWPEKVSPSLSARTFRDVVATTLEERELEPATFDCTEFPCVALLPEGATEDAFREVRRRIQTVVGNEAEEYGYMRLLDTKVDGPAAYVVSVVPRIGPGDTTAEEIRERVRERSSAHAHSVDTTQEPG